MSFSGSYETFRTFAIFSPITAVFRPAFFFQACGKDMTTLYKTAVLGCYEVGSWTGSRTTLLSGMDMTFSDHDSLDFIKCWFIVGMVIEFCGLSRRVSSHSPGLVERAAIL